jgi:hypothetical protein
MILASPQNRGRASRVSLPVESCNGRLAGADPQKAVVFVRVECIVRKNMDIKRGLPIHDAS